VTIVVAAVIERDGAFLVTRRPSGTHLGGFWEFPGGKAGADETDAQALSREIREELDVGIDVGELELETAYAYPNRELTLRFYRCTLHGAPRPRLGQQMQWVSLDALPTLDFPPADEALIKRLTQRVDR
jgi:mutator protein MutT